HQHGTGVARSGVPPPDWAQQTRSAEHDPAHRARRRRSRHDDITVHGFRSTFRDWAAEATNHHANHVVEMALAHTIGSAVEAAYPRGDLFEKRRVLMNAWANYLSLEPAQVIPPVRRS